MCDRGLDPVVYASLYLGSEAEDRLLQEQFVQQSIQRFVAGAFTAVLHVLSTFIDCPHVVNSVICKILK